MFKHKEKTETMKDAQFVFENGYETYGRFFNSVDDYFNFDNQYDVEKYEDYVAASRPNKQARVDEMEASLPRNIAPLINNNNNNNNNSGGTGANPFIDCPMPPRPSNPINADLLYSISSPKEEKFFFYPPDTDNICCSCHYDNLECVSSKCFQERKKLFENTSAMLVFFQFSLHYPSASTKE